MTGRKPPIPLAERWRTWSGEADKEAGHYTPGAPRRHDIELRASVYRLAASDLTTAHLADRAPEVTELLKRCLNADQGPWHTGGDITAIVEAWFRENGYDTTTGEPRR